VDLSIDLAGLVRVIGPKPPAVANYTHSARMKTARCAGMSCQAAARDGRPRLPWRSWKRNGPRRRCSAASRGASWGERRALEAWLDFHRDTLLLKCAGLTAGQLKERAVPPSRLSLLGLVRHMTEVERQWFRVHAANTDMTYPYDPDQSGQDFEALDDADAAANIGAFRQEIEHARAAVAGRQLDDVVPSHGHQRERTRDIRWIYLHMIEEYACHNGHADLIRERIDGIAGD